MGTIIHLNPLPRGAAPATAGDALRQCEIVIFPGVRIEREETPLVPDAAQSETDGGSGHGSRPRKSS